MLYLVASPIGNLADFSFRAVETLNFCDLILCEDTRHTATLLHHYKITKPLKSYHKFNESSREDWLIDLLKEGKKIALLSDAGTPGIADPGVMLVKKCRENHITVHSIPGACAAITALSISGFDSERFQFLGFLPKKQEALKKILFDALSYPGTSIFYESPHRLLSTLSFLEEINPQRIVGIARELTKRFEEFLQGTSTELLKHWQDLKVRGEIVLLISGDPNPSIDWSDLTPEQHVKMVGEMYGLSKKDAIKTVAQLRGVSKKTIYNGLLS